MVICRLDKLGVLFKDTVQITTALGDVTFQPASKSYVRVCVNEHLHVQYLTTHIQT